jgi:hypothetical protein
MLSIFKAVGRSVVRIVAVVSTALVALVTTSSAISISCRYFCLL